MLRGSGELQLVNLGSKKIPSPLSSYLGELEALKWALQASKGIRGDRLPVVKSDNKGVVQSWGTHPLKFDDIRVARHWA